MYNITVVKICVSRLLVKLSFFKVTKTLWLVNICYYYHYMSLLHCCKLQLVKHKVKTRCDNMLCKHYKKSWKRTLYGILYKYTCKYEENITIYIFTYGESLLFRYMCLSHRLLVPRERLCVSLWRIMVSGNCAKFLMRFSNVSFSQPGRRCYITFGVSWIFSVFMGTLCILCEKSLGYRRWWW